MKCPTCNFENQTNSKFCSQCGVSLVGVCPRCSFSYIPENANFCPECGFKLYAGEIVLISSAHHKDALVVDSIILNHVVNKLDFNTFVQIKQRNHSIANLLLSLQRPTHLIISALQYKNVLR